MLIKPSASARKPAPDRRDYHRPIADLAEQLNYPALVDDFRRFLYSRAHPDDDLASISLEDCPQYDGKIDVFHSAVAKFYAPSDECGVGGMHRERIRAVPIWQNGPGRYDCVYVSTDSTAPGFRGMQVARVLLFFGFKLEKVFHSAAFIQWYHTFGDAPEADTGLWIVEPETHGDGSRLTQVIDLDTVVRGAHLIGIAGDHPLPSTLKFHDSLDSFRAFYVNKYIDHHAHEIAF